MGSKGLDLLIAENIWVVVGDRRSKKLLSLENYFFITRILSACWWWWSYCSELYKLRLANLDLRMVLDDRG